MNSSTMKIDSPARTAARLTLSGRVQGIGLRPAVARLAACLSLAGYVGNTPAGVEIHVEGPIVDVERFERELPGHLPAAAELLSLEIVRAGVLDLETFHVGPVADRSADQGELTGRVDCLSSLSTRVPPDVVVCQECLIEVNNGSDRRHRYPLTSCTDCGPRYSIIERMPYEREQTSMAAFPLCHRCREEYGSASERRFHAQTSACPACGPRVWLRDESGRVIGRGGDALQAASSAIRDGKIVALRGLGGYQLLVDATCQEAVERLRQRKQRRGKPLAVMVSSPRAAEKIVQLDETERSVLGSPAGPIVVAAARSDAGVAPSVTAGLNTIGVMLPTTPWHALLLASVARPVVCTSANLAADPLIYQSESALAELRGVADVWWEHDRPILRPIDDSVVRVMADRPVSIRLARGYAPLSLGIEAVEPLLAVGGQQKTSIALANGAQAVLGPHVGDLDTVAARQRYVEQLKSLSNLYGIEQSDFVCDQHPDYFTSVWAANQMANVARTQHHHAHIVAGMLEHNWLDREVLGVAFDGTGYGADGTIWGGEFLRATATGFERVGHLRPFCLPGGERAVRDPWRVATALVREAAGEEVAARLQFHTGDVSALLPVLQRPRLSMTTTSAGRLFDGVAALVLGMEQCVYEGEAAMKLEAACDTSASGQYDMAISTTEPRQLDWRRLVRQVLSERAAGVSPGAMAMRFHRGLAEAIYRVCRSHSPLPVVLGGGVFQNRVLSELLAARFSDSDQPLGLPGMIPPNDGGLAAGQLAVAAALAHRRRAVSCA